RPTEPSFHVNCSLTNKQTKFDIQYGKPTEMVAELKVYGYCRYQTKNLHGGSGVARFIPTTDRTRIRLGLPEIRAIPPRSGSYLNDVLRLHSLPSNIERYLILVLQK